MTTAMEGMGRSVVCLALELHADVYADVATKWDAACAEHLAAVAALEDEIDRLRELEEAVREAGHYDTCDAMLSPDMVCSCPARLASPVPPVSR